MPASPAPVAASAIPAPTHAPPATPTATMESPSAVTSAAVSSPATAATATLDLDQLRLVSGAAAVGGITAARRLERRDQRWKCVGRTCQSRNGSRSRGKPKRVAKKFSSVHGNRPHRVPFGVLPDDQVCSIAKCSRSASDDPGEIAQLRCTCLCDCWQYLSIRGSDERTFTV